MDTEARPETPPVISGFLENVRPMTLPDALAFARSHQPSIALARTRVRTAQAIASVADAQWLPQVSGLGEVVGGSNNNTSTSYVGGGSIGLVRIGGSSAVTKGALTPYASTIVGLGATQELFDFGRIAAQKVALESLAELARYRGEADALEVGLLVRQAYFAVHAAHAVASASDAAWSRAKVHRDLAAAGVASGLRPPLELTRAEAALLGFEVDRIRARGGLEVARGVLAAAIGATEGELDVTGDPVEEATARPPLQEALRLAESRDPLLKEALAAVRAQQATTTGIGAETLPNVFATTSLSTRAGGAPLANGTTPTGQGFLPVIPNWDVGVVLTVPLFDGVVRARERASLAKEEELRAQLDNRRALAIADVRRAWWSAVIAERSLPALERALEAARANWIQADSRFKAGLASIVEVADAEALLTQADIRLAIGKFEDRRARAVLARALAEDR